MYDFHSHLLPNIPGDDGARSYDMAYHMARQSVSAGFTHVLATSHFIAGEPFGKCEDLKVAARTISKFLRGKGMNLEIVPAHEAYLTPELIQHIKNREVILIGNRYLLAELPMSGWQKETLSLIAELSEMSINVIIAHPERCQAIIDNPDLAVALIDSGAYLQLNLSSLKHPKSGAGKTANALLRYQMYHFIGSDAHSDIQRSPLVQKELALLKSQVSQHYYDLVTKDNPERAFMGAFVENHCDESWTSFETAKVQPSRYANVWQRLGAALFAQG